MTHFAFDTAMLPTATWSFNLPLSNSNTSDSYFSLKLECPIVYTVSLFPPLTRSYAFWPVNLFSCTSEELLHTFAQHGTAVNVPQSSILPLTRGMDGDVTVSNSEVDSNLIAPYALNFGVTYLWKDAKGGWARVFLNDQNYDRVTCV